MFIITRITDQLGSGNIATQTQNFHYNSACGGESTNIFKGDTRHTLYQRESGNSLHGSFLIDKYKISNKIKMHCMARPVVYKFCHPQYKDTR